MVAGENTLNALCARVVLRGIAREGRYDPAAFLDDYVAFMTTPGEAGARGGGDTSCMRRATVRLLTASRLQRWSTAGCRPQPIQSQLKAVRLIPHTFVTPPCAAGTHNDTYAESFHRDFFSNWAAGVPPADCAKVRQLAHAGALRVDQCTACAPAG